MRAPADDHLYLTEEEVARRLLTPRRRNLWPGLVPSLERHGLPKIDPVFGGRYWPAVKAYLDRRHGLRDTDVPQLPDGEDNYDALFDR